MKTSARSASATHAWLLRRIARIELLGFGVILGLLWANELLDLPHRLFGDPATQTRLSELAVESLALTLLAGVVLVLTSRLLMHVAYLENYVVLCAWCRRIRSDQQWLSLEAYLGEHRAEASHGMCPECEAKFDT